MKSCNRPFYSCLLSDLAFEWQWGCSWPCFDTDLSGFFMLKHLVSVITTWFMQQKQWGLYQNKVTSSLAAIHWSGHWADSWKIVYCDISKKVHFCTDFNKIHMQCSSSRHTTAMRSFTSFTSVCQPIETKKERKNLFQQLKVIFNDHY